MMSLTEGTGHLFYEGSKAFYVHNIDMLEMDTQIGYKLKGEIHVCMSDIDWKL